MQNGKPEDEQRPAPPPHPEPADPHPADEELQNVYNPSPGGDTHSEHHSTDLEADPEFPGSPA